MRINTLPTILELLGSGILALSLSTSALAADQEVCEPDTCPKGFVCEQMPQPCLAIACVDDACDSSCGSSTTTACVRASCEADVDCGADMVCATFENESCSEDAAPCAVDETCPRVVDTPCTTETVRECTPKWELPCATAADCGEGFTCVESIIQWCSGGASVVDTASGGADDSAEPTECGSDPTGEFYCKVVETACTVDGDCPENWTCVANPNGMCWADTDGNSGCDVPDPARLCQPPYSDREYFGGLNLAGEAAGIGSATNGLSDNGVPATSDGTPEAGTEPSSNEPQSGCSIGPTLTGPASSASAWLLGLLAVLGIRRRS